MTARTATGFAPRYTPPTQVDVLGQNGEVVLTTEMPAIALTPSGEPVDEKLRDALDLATRVVERLLAEWPGTRQLEADGIMRTFPPVRAGGSTHAIIEMAGQIVAEEAAK